MAEWCADGEVECQLRAWKWTVCAGCDGGSRKYGVSWRVLAERNRGLALLSKINRVTSQRNRVSGG